VPLITVVILVPATAYIFWLDHPSNPDAYTRIDDYLYDINYVECGHSGWPAALVPPAVAAFLGAPILLVTSLVLAFRRRERSWLALSLAAIILFVFAMVTGGFIIDASYASEC
jgi:hypothetical protein